MEFTLLGAAFMGVVPLYGVLYYEAKRGNAAGCTRELWDIAIGAVVAGLFLGRLAAMVGDGVNPITNPGDILIVRGGVATGVATVGAIFTAAWLGRTTMWPVLDGLAAASLAGLAGWHAGCVVRDSCLGTPSDLPWAFAQEGSSITRHPVEIYAALALIIAAIALAWWRRRWMQPGVAAASALVAASLIRLATEPLRPHLGAGSSRLYVVGALVGLGLLVWRVADGRRSLATPD